MIQEIKDLIQSVNPLYEVEYEENRMMNLRVDEKTSSARFAYIEEFVSGTYERNKYVPQKTTRMQLYFCRFCEMHNSALDREFIRNEIEKEIIFPFIKKYNDSGFFDRVEIWNFVSALPRFDANEISVMLQFDCKQNYYV